ncbi:MAG: hypothetical protein ACREP5_10260 [Candidatus Binatia bacterium]
MIIRAGIMAVLVSLCVPLVSLAQSSGSTANSVQNLNLQDIAEDSVIVLSKEESGITGYFQTEYAYVDSACPDGIQLVYFSGPSVDINDRDLRLNERRLCSTRVYDSGGDD